MRRVSDAFKAFIEGQEPELAQGLAEALESTEPSVSVRLNMRKLGERRPDVLKLEGVAPVPWCANGFYLPARPDFTHDPALHQGLYYVQDASSMIIARVVEALASKAPVRYLDACAAPGGKTTAAMDALPKGSLVVANEFDFRRAEILKENVAKWGYPEVVVSRGDTARFRNLPGWFDIIAADVPCSGEGMMRKDATARSQWSPALVRECAARQDEILGNIWEALRPGGYLVYSTCTFNAVENEQLISRFAADNGAESIDTGLTEFPGVLPALKDYPGIMAARFLPSRVRGEGIFVSILRKPGIHIPSVNDLPATHRTSRKDRRQNAPRTDLRSYAAQITDPTAIVEASGDSVRALPASHANFIHTLEKELQTIHAGVELATIKGRDAIPSHTLAMSRILSPAAFPTAEISLADTLSYLRREAIPLEAGTPRGYVLLTHAGHPLGFAKNLGSRANNLYPAPWRIRNL